MDKCICWLKRKMNVIQNVLRNGLVHVAGAGAQAATFVRNKKEKTVSEGIFLVDKNGYRLVLTRIKMHCR